MRMIKQQKKEFSAEGKREVVKKQSLNVMDHHELSLIPSSSTLTDIVNSSCSYFEANRCRKRKCIRDEPRIHASIELQLNDPLPIDWEQCLDLQSGRMYYLNRKTLKKIWNRPKEQELDLDLELSISTLPCSEGNTGFRTLEDSKKHSNSSSSMVAVACLNCHLLVMLCKSSPSCPNCKYVHSLPTQQTPRIEAAKSYETLNLLN